MLGLLAGRDVLRLAEQVDDLTVATADRGDGKPDPDEMSELVPVANLAVVGLDLASQQPPDLTAVELELLVGDDVLKRAAEQLALAVAADPAQRGVDAQEPP